MLSRHKKSAWALVGALTVLALSYSGGAAADAITLDVIREISGTIEANGVPLAGFPVGSSNNTLLDPTWGDSLVATDVLVNSGSVPDTDPLQSWEQIASGGADVTSSFPATAGAYQASGGSSASVANAQENLTDAPFVTALSEWHSAFGVLFRLDAPHHFHLTGEFSRSDASATNLFFLSSIDPATFQGFGTPGPVTFFSISDDDGVFDIEGVLSAGFYEAYGFTGSSASSDLPEEQVSLAFGRFELEYKEIVPEPSTVVLLGLALSGMVLRRRLNGR